MTWVNTVWVLAAALFSFGCAASRVSPNHVNVSGEFVGSTPCDAVPRGFLGIPSPAACERISWQLMLQADNPSAQGGTYTLVTVHGISETNGAGFFQGGTKLQTTGQWKMTTGTQADRERPVYQLSSTDARHRLLLARIDENLLHVLGEDRRLMVGNDGWSYTLNRRRP